MLPDPRHRPAHPFIMRIDTEVVEVEMRSIFAGLGLGGDFWDPQSDSFG